MNHIKIINKENFRTDCIHQSTGVTISTAPPQEVHPQGGTLFSPTDLLSASVGSCMMTLMSMAAKKVDFDLSGCIIDVEKEMVSTPQRRVGRFMIKIQVKQKAIESIRLQLEKAALGCPVFLSLHPDIKKEVEFVWGF
jgi:uncharacterized OsmC-like protein